MMDYIFHIDKYLFELIPTWGNYVYLVVTMVVFLESACVLTPFLPGDGLLFILGLFSAQQLLNIEIIVPLIFLATLVGYALNYMLGKRLGIKIMPWLIKRGLKKSLDDSEGYYQRYGVKALVIARFIPIVRTFMPLMIGILDLPKATFWMANLIGASLWVAVMIGAGWCFGKLGMVNSNISFVIFGIMFISILPIIFESIKIYWKNHYV
ncbi:MAG: VTT domain-containing protein [Gammaproteobacteria bacterium]|nr:VTT domain-containing protein [Gammaproteobacteria bacterium]